MVFESENEMLLIRLDSTRPGRSGGVPVKMRWQWENVDADGGGEGVTYDVFVLERVAVAANND